MSGNDLRVGDVVYDQDGYGLYGVVVSIDYSKERYTYVSVDNNDEINWDLTGYFDDLNLSRTYTRYPEDSDYDYSDRNHIPVILIYNWKGERSLKLTGTKESVQLADNEVISAIKERIPGPAGL